MLEKTGRKLIGISYDSVAVLSAFSTRRKIGFVLLSDEGSAFIRKLGIFNEKQPRESLKYGVPYPGSFVLDSSGKILSKSFEEDPRERETLGAILSSTFDISTGLVTSTHSTNHLTAVTSASNAVIRPFQVIRLRLDVHLKPGMHVYAPGVVGYKAIAWELDTSLAFRARRQLFPPSKQLFLRAIDETVQVYDGEFHVQTEIAFPEHGQIAKAVNEHGQLLVSGSFTYQACDDKTCYLPFKVPTSWTFQYENLDEPRVPEQIRRANPAVVVQ